MKAEDLCRCLRISRAASYKLLKRAGAIKVGERNLRLPVTKLINVLGEELAEHVVKMARAHEEET